MRIAPGARDDLRDIRIYSKSAFGAVAARIYLQGLQGVFTFIAQHPLSGMPESDLGQDIRSFAHRSHRVYYRIDPGGILIVRVLHHARDAPHAMGGGA